MPSGQQRIVRRLALAPNMYQPLPDKSLGGANGRRESHLTRGLAFFFGFCIEFNILVGGNGEGAAATGGYGYRISDFLCLVAIVLLGLRALLTSRLVPLTVFAAAMVVLSAVRVLEPTFADDPRTVILALHYLAYSFAGLYLAMLLYDEAARYAYCWGLVLGLLATVPIFVMQDLGQEDLLVRFGLLPGFYHVLHLDVGGTLRYAGLWGHPNEASHVAALAAPAGAYLFFVRRRMLPLVLTAAALFAVFYYTQSRGGLVAGGGILALSLLIGRRGNISILRFALACVGITISVELASQFEFFSSRFADPGAAGNFADRLSSILYGVETVLTNPFGLSIYDFTEILAAGTGGVGSPHNGFLAFAGIFGWLPFAVLVVAMLRCLSIRSELDALFAFITLGLVFSFMFEELTLSYPYAFVTCMIVGHAFLTTGIGGALVANKTIQGKPAHRSGFRFAPQ
jgi:hypothetical protein